MDGLFTENTMSICPVDELFDLVQRAIIEQDSELIQAIAQISSLQAVIYTPNTDQYGTVCANEGGEVQIKLADDGDNPASETEFAVNIGKIRCAICPHRPGGTAPRG